MSGTTRRELVERYARGKERVGGHLKWHSFSGHERNRLFANDRGERFWDISSLSHMDQIADSRSIALFDFDHDGRMDILLANASDPLLNLYRNRTSDSTAGENFLVIRLLGGNTQDSADFHRTARDAYGAKVWVRTGDRVVYRELRCGEGFAAQNSDRLLIGVGGVDQGERPVAVGPRAINSPGAGRAAGDASRTWPRPGRYWVGGHGPIRTAGQRWALHRGRCPFTRLHGPGTRACSSIDVITTHTIGW